MVNFPKNFVAIKDYPGYFFDIENEKLYSIKIGGELRPLKYYEFLYVEKDGGYETIYKPHYQVSKYGNKETLTINKIKKLMINDDYEIPIRK